jgi:hypothetical protein
MRQKLIKPDAVTDGTRDDDWRESGGGRLRRQRDSRRE